MVTYIFHLLFYCTISYLFLLTILFDSRIQGYLIAKFYKTTSQVFIRA